MCLFYVFLALFFVSFIFWFFLDEGWVVMMDDRGLRGEDVVREVDSGDLRYSEQ